MDRWIREKLHNSGSSDISVHKRSPGCEQTHADCIPLIRLNLDHGRKSVILLLLCVLVRGATRGAREKQIAFSVTSVPKKQRPTQM